MHIHIDHLELKRAKGCALLAFMACFVFLGYGCSEGVPEVLKSSRFTAPDSKVEVTLELVHNGLGLGAGDIFDEIHVSEPGAKFTHGDRDSSVVFYMESSGMDGDRPVIEWIGAHKLLVKYPDGTVPGKMQSQILGVSIEYRTFHLPPRRNEETRSNH